MFKESVVYITNNNCQQNVANGREDSGNFAPFLLSTFPTYSRGVRYKPKTHEPVVNNITFWSTIHQIFICQYFESRLDTTGCWQRIALNEIKTLGLGHAHRGTGVL